MKNAKSERKIHKWKIIESKQPPNETEHTKTFTWKKNQRNLNANTQKNPSVAVSQTKQQFYWFV